MYATYKKHRLAIYLIIAAVLVMSCTIICGAQIGVTYGEGEAALGSYVARVTSDGTVKQFVTIDEAFTYANSLDGEVEIKLIANATVKNSIISVDDNKNITLDLNGFMLRFFTFGDFQTADDGLYVYGSFTLVDSRPYVEHEYLLATGSDGGINIAMWFFYDGEDEKNFYETQIGNATFEVKTLCGGVIANAMAGVTVYGEVTMNGGSISGMMSDGVSVEDGSFTMNGGSICGSYGGSGVSVDGGSFTMEGGKITDNLSLGAGGVSVDGGSFTMTGGSICDNTGLYGAGSVDVGGFVYDGDDEVIARGTFIMTGGEISNNMTIYGNCGGVYVAQNGFGKCAIFAISGAPVITGNHLIDGSESNVYLEEGVTITVKGKLEDEFGNSAQIGIYIVDIVLTADYGKNNKKDGITINPGRYFIPDREGYVTVLENGEGKLAEGKVTVQIGDEITAHEDINEAFDTANSANDLAIVTVFANLTFTDITVNADSEITLDLNGYVLSGTVVAEIGIHIQGTFTLTDGRPNAEHNYSVESGSTVQGANYKRWVFDESGTETCYGGIITDIRADANIIVNGGSFTMDGGAIAGNFVGYGVTVGVASFGESAAKSKFVMNSGKIVGNALTYFGGVYVNGGTFEMNGGLISENMAVYFTINPQSGLGGGVCVDGGTFEMTGGTITENKAGQNGGGVYIANGSFNISGAPVITGNTVNDTANDVCLVEDGKITVNGKIIEGAEIYIYNTGAVATGYDQTDDPSSFFFSDYTANGCVYISDKTNGAVSIGTHDAATAWSIDTDNDAHYHACENGCGERFDETAHVYNCEVATEAYLKTLATCKAKAVYSLSCVCGAYGTGTFEYGGYAEHTLEAVELKAATCTTDGVLAHEHCTECGKDFIEGVEKTADELKIAIAEHTHAAAVRENEVAATCSSAGSYDEVVYCSVCGDEISRTEKVINKIDHTGREAVRENYVAATCSSAGSYDEVVYCSECHEEISRTPKTVTIDHTAHSFGQWQDEIASNCTVTGTKGHKDCTLCHKHFDGEYVEITDLTIATNDEHKWDDGTVTKEPTCTEAGEKTFTCLHNSAHTQKEGIGAMEHSYGEWSVTTEATCTETGRKSRVCAHDDTHVETEEIAALGHDYGEWTVTKEPTVDEEGEKQRVCNTDGNHVETSPIAKLQAPEQTKPFDWWIIVVIVFAIIDAVEAGHLIYRKTRKSKADNSNEGGNE